MIVRDYVRNNKPPHPDRKICIFFETIFEIYSS